MRVFALIALVALAIVSAFTQSSTKPKKTSAKPTPSRSSSAAKAKPTPKKTTATAAKPKPTPKKPDEATQWNKATALTDLGEKITALQKFNADFPKSERQAESLEFISNARTTLAAEKTAAGDVAGAATLYKLALAEGPAKLSEAAFRDKFSKAPTDLYFRGERTSAIEIAKLIEEKAEGNATQLLQISQFYLSTENGDEAKRVAEKAVAVAPSSLAYQTLGLANRMQFALDDAAAAYAKALELEPDSMPARRGLAEMKRALGKPADAAKLYQEILDKDSGSIPARTGLIMSMFESGRQADAEAELAKAVEANPTNVILLASAAYWYAASNVGEKAVDLAGQAIASDARFIWSHIAAARGLMLQGKAAEAEKTLLRAQRYGNFPTVQYELASAKIALGFYKEAAEQLALSFAITGGQVRTNLGGRVARSAKGFTELLEDERRSSIFAPTAADTMMNSTQLAALLSFHQELDSKEANAERIAKAADALVGGNDKHRLFRQLYAASALMDKNLALPKAIELSKTAISGVDAALDVPDAATMVLASELYDSRRTAMARGEYVRVPEIPRATLSAVIRGRIEEIQGWGMLQTGDKDGGLVRLRRAVGVLPAESSYWREATWRLGSALALAGKDAEAIETYIKAYKSGPPSGSRYSMIESMYRRLNGNVDGLEDKIGKNPNPSETVATQKPDPSPTPEAATQATPEVKTEASPTPIPLPIKAEGTPTASPESNPDPSPTPVISPTSTPSDAAVAKAEPSPSPGKELFPPVVITVPTPSDPKTERPTDAGDIKPCTLTSSEESLTLQNGGGDLAVIVGTEDDRDIDGITATPSSAKDIAVRRESIPGVKARALFVVKALGTTPGMFQIKFELPCGKRDLIVKIR